MDATDKGQQPSGVSKACLSCHDGVTAINQKIDGTYIGTSGTTITGSAAIGLDLHITHPVSITYDDALATADGTLFSPSSVLRFGAGVNPVPLGTSLTGKTIAQALLKNGKVECGSCHDVHKTVGYSPNSGSMQRIGGVDANGVGSLLCRSCHNKEGL